MRYRNDEESIKLEYYSEQFAKKLFKKFPQWKQHAGHYKKGEPGLYEYYLDVNVPSANPSVSAPLNIKTYPKEVIVSWFDGNHRHFDSPLDRSDLGYMERAIEFLERVVRDEIIFASYRREGVSVSGYYYSLEVENPERWISDDCETIIRSWLGGHDRDVKPQTVAEKAEEERARLR